MSRKKGMKTESEAILCPLFREFSASTIKCESHLPDSETVEFRYSDTARCKTQRTVFCEGIWKRCEHYRSWMHMKWSDEDD